MAKFSSAAATASALIAKNGTTVTFSRKATGTFDPVTQVETSSVTTFSMPGLALAPGKSAEFRIGSLANRNLMELHLAPGLGTVPEPGDQVTWAGKNWSIIWVSALDPAADGAPYALAYAEK